MKKVLILLAFLFCAVLSFAQYPNSQSVSNTLTIYHAKGALKGDSAFMLPVNDTLNNLATPYYGAVTVLPSDVLKDTIPIWMSNGHHWIRFQGSSGGFNINDTIYTRLPIYVDTVSNPGKRVIAFLRENGLISGGVVTVDSCMTIDVTAPTFLINYKQYVGLATFGIVITPSNVLPRIDRVVIDTNLLITVIVGTPSATPVAPPYNSFSQVSLAEIPVGAGVTCLGTQEIIYDGVADFAGQWTITTAGTGSTSFTNTANPYHLTQASYTVTYSNGYQIIYTKPSGTDTVKATSILKGFITLIGGLTAPNQISGQWYNGTTAVSSPLLLNAYFNPNDSNVYQMFVVPLNAWSWPGGSVFNKLVLTFGGNDNSGAKGVYLDWIQLQTGIGSPAKQYQDSSRIIAGWLTDFYNGIGIRRDSIVGGSGGSGWLLLGNAATDTSLNFLGTTDNRKLNFRVNNILAGSIGTNTTYNVSLGTLSLPVTSTGVKNTAIGGGALGLNTTGFSNTSLGYTANYHNVIGNSNTAVGWASLGWNNGTGNTAIGSEAYNSTPSSVSTGTYNTAIGHQALLDNASHNYNTGIGIRAGASAAQDFTLYMSDSTKHGYWKALDSATGTAPNVLSIDPLGFIHRYAAPSGGGGGGNNIYNIDSTFSSNRTASLNGTSFRIRDISGTGEDLFNLEEGYGNIRAFDNASDNEATLTANASPTESSFVLGTIFNSVFGPIIQGIVNVSGNTITHTADTHTFNATAAINGNVISGSNYSNIALAPVFNQILNGNDTAYTNYAGYIGADSSATFSQMATYFSINGKAYQHSINVFPNFIEVNGAEGAGDSHVNFRIKNPDTLSTAPSYMYVPDADTIKVYPFLGAVAKADLTAQSSAVGSIATYTPTANGTFRIGGYINITAVTAGIVTLKVTYTDENSQAVTQIIPLTIAATGAVGTTATVLNSNNSALDIEIRAKSGSAITVLTTLTNVATYDVGATIEKLR